MFYSTRGNKLVSSPEAILNGLAEDGGLYVIDKLPNLNYQDLLNDDYQTMAAKILYAFFPEFGYGEIKQEINEAYSTFDIKEVVRLKQCDNTYFLELFHGPTLAFKDLALVVLPRLMKMAKDKLNKKKTLTILTATSGDTGGAALNGFRNIDGVSIVVLYPNGGVSPIQEAQMCSFKSANAKVLALNGNFDDCQSFVKDFFASHHELELSSANSINIARLIPQVVYYFYSYLELVKTKQIEMGDEINFDVPTGNFGNIFAGFYAKKMGLPIANLICASNKNDVLTDFFNTGKYNKNRLFYRTNSPSMDILISSNLERLIFYGTEKNHELTKDFMDNLKTQGEYSFTNPFTYFKAYASNEKETLQTIKNIYQSYSYLIDTHTAVAYSAYNKYVKDSNDVKKTVIISTASPYKFPQSVLEAFNLKASDPMSSINLMANEFSLEIPKVLNYPEVKREVLDKDEAEAYLVDVIKCFK